MGTQTSVSDSFECNICLDSVQDPVVTLCGHLYCWACIYKWIQHQNTSSQLNQKAHCPICKTEISQNTIVPLYNGPSGRLTTNYKGTKETAPNIGSVVPPRPRRLAVQRSRGGGYRQHAPPSLAMPGGGSGGGGGGGGGGDDGGGGRVVVPSPTIGVLGEMVCGRILGELGSPLFATPDSYNYMVGMSSSRRERWEMTRVDRSLSGIYIFLFCGMILSVLLF